VECLDIGHSIDPKEIKKTKWSIIQIHNPEFHNKFSFGSVALTNNELLVFGGSQVSSFIFDSKHLQSLIAAKKDLKKANVDTEAIMKS